MNTVRSFRLWAGLGLATGLTLITYGLWPSPAGAGPARPVYQLHVVQLGAWHAHNPPRRHLPQLQQCTPDSPPTVPCWA